MKEIWMEWMNNLAVFSLISSVAMKLLPGKVYKSYVKLFTGIVMILLFLDPVLSLFGLEKEIAKSVTDNWYEIEMTQMETKLIEVEEKQKERLEKQYQEMMEDQNDG